MGVNQRFVRPHVFNERNWSGLDYPYPRYSCGEQAGRWGGSQGAAHPCRMPKMLGGRRESSCPSGRGGLEEFPPPPIGMLFWGPLGPLCAERFLSVNLQVCCFQPQSLPIVFAFMLKILLRTTTTRVTNTRERDNFPHCQASIRPQGLGEVSDSDR